MTVPMPSPPILSASDAPFPPGRARPGALVRAAAGAVPPSGLVVLAILSVQLGAGIAKNLFAALPPSAVVFLRIATGALILGVVARPRLRGLTRRDLAAGLAFGVTLGVMNLAFYEGLARLPMGICVTIEFLGPLGVAVAASRRRLDLVWVALAAAGIALLAPWDGGTGLDWLGVAFAAIAGACWAAYILLSAAVGKRFPGTTGLSFAMIVAVAVSAPAGVAAGGAELLRPELLLLGAGVGLLSSVIPYSLELEALRRMPKRVFGILMSLEPAAAALVGLLVLGEILGLREWAAIGCVVVASVGATRTS
ncbi:threonine transporter RhtB [Sphaerisporangium siamense]|uniref:Inner membrane transporter RhtA n=1 Tax=Sphaerisporangium siamense TaxID=795645 RepID=A0A7W7GBF8_9ACTN|nr:EamA family transporter [Sphaerisporangium siamense]MBB4703432.1 inner membrane transporter RhtA [Sphaerisporangium siamense]GII87574.1 threonine transporter RhtB [Sphaerisporangium siamense]